jgi:hypothetical protein
MGRLTISLPETLASAAAKRAAAQKRSTSSYVAILIEDDLREAGILNAGEPDTAELLAKLQAALDQNPALRPELDALLRRSTRARRAGDKAA